MRATVMYAGGDVRVEEFPDPVVEHPADAVVRIVRSCICDSDLHPYHKRTAATAAPRWATSSSASWRTSAMT